MLNSQALRKLNASERRALLSDYLCNRGNHCISNNEKRVKSCNCV